ncbi:hypothetical protein F5Y13DRAFT_183807 [Hypoxylon sp. FL1857]|nr:hypothetical protein F5Y13DRAFT_183807 [Hypoxylon sp. FL1857]
MGVTSKQPASDIVAKGSPQAVEGNGIYYIYAQEAGKGETDDIHSLAGGSPIDTFVASLNDEKVIKLASAPSALSRTVSLYSAGENTDEEPDETIHWFQQLDSEATGSVTVDNSNNIESFEFQLTEPCPLTFSSASGVLLLTFGPPLSGTNTFRIPPPGVDADGEMLTLGLDPSQPVDFESTLGELLSYAEVEDSVPSFLSSLSVTLSTPGQGDPQRNALWFVPAADRRITMRLQFQVPVLDDLGSILQSELTGFTLKSANVILYKDMVSAATESGVKPVLQGSVAFGIDCSVKGPEASDPEVSMTAGIELSESIMSLTFQFVSPDPLTGILMWLSSLIGDSSDSPASLESFVTGLLDKEENGVKLLPDFTLRRMKVNLDTTNPDQAKLSSFSFDIEVSANLGGRSNLNPTVFLMSYSWSSLMGKFGQLSGQLWYDPDSAMDEDLLPHIEKWSNLHPVTTNPASSIDLESLIPGQTVDNIPDTLPSEITAAYIALSADSFDIRCSIKADPPDANPSGPDAPWAPQPYLGEVTLEASFSWGQSSSFELDVFISAGIESSQDASEDAVLQGSLHYDSASKTWSLDASLTGLYASTLVEFFDQDSKAYVGPLISSIGIDSLDVSYKYTGKTEKQSTASEFAIKGDLLVADLSLALDFEYNKEGFTFSAKLNPQDESAKIGDILASIIGSDIELPDFVYNTELVGSDQNSDTQNLFTLDIVRMKTLAAEAGTKTDQDSFFFLAQLNVADVYIDFAQMSNTSWKIIPPCKRLIKLGIRGFGGIPLELPLIGTLTQPLDELYFLWVQDPTPQSTAPGATPGKGPGLARSDLAELNKRLGSDNQIFVNDKIKPELRTSSDLLLAAGCHFAIIIHSNTGVRSCLLDYEFLKPSATSGKMITAAAAEPQADDNSPSTQAPYKKIAGPLSISNVGLKYKDKALAVMFDATFQLGPLGFSLVGFSLGFSFTTLDQVPTIKPDIAGLAASFEQPPLSIAGVIRHGNDGVLDYYAGGLIVGWIPYQFEAAGFYGTVTPKGGSEFKSVFIFAKLNGPLVTLEFAEIDSLTGGFGYNSSVRLPTVDEVYEFPFIASTELGGTSDALQVLERLVDPGPAGWFKPLDKTYWLAVGMGVGAFQMLTIDAVVVVTFGNSVKLGIFAIATADVPTPTSSFKIAHVELGISAIADFDYGTLKINAQLSPSSYILDPNCHLTGGFGLYYWFDAPHADKSIVGQYVFTLGGYHQAFTVPTGFPNPPRLAISWNLGGGLSISGQAYFAITPKACMAGGRLHAAFSAGPLTAWFDAFADCLINYKPFYFNMQAGLAVGIKFSLDIWFIHIRISVEIGADLYLWGPPVAGRVHVDFWIAAFDINFGNDASRNEAVSLEDFYLLVLQTSSNPGLSAATSGKLIPGAEDEVEAKEELESSVITRPVNEGHNFLAQSGLLNSNDKPERQQDDAWYVRAGSFSFVVECKMPINAFTNELGGDPIITYGDVYGKPMKLKSPLDSVLTVKVVEQVKQGEPPVTDVGWQYDKYLKSLPHGLWAVYNESSDPRLRGNNISDLLNSDEGAITLMAGVLITAPKATIAPDPFPPYQVADADLQTLLSEKPFPALATADDAWAPDQPSTGDNVKEQYDAVYGAWNNASTSPGNGVQKGFVELLAKTMQWKTAGISGDAQLVPGIPYTEEEFMNSYVAAPLLTK